MKDNNVRIARRAALQAAVGIASLTPLGAAKTNQRNGRRNGPDLQTPIVETVSGKVRGFVSDGVAIFRGIPYGASTTGANRFMPPAAPKPWSGVRNCLTYGHSCPQGGTGVIENDIETRSTDEDNFLLYRTGGWIRGEDCLRLNVWTPSTSSSGRKKAVMVYMHGGGFTGGSGNDLLSYDGENLARRHDVVVVTHNHRLNLFGYLHLADIGGERYAGSGNVGMLDIVAVLGWIRENIANFGGDPANVTIFGQSGGGGKVTALMAMPAATGLFHRAVVQSGSMMRSGNAASSARIAALVLEELGISKAELEKLHSIPTSALQAVQPRIAKRMASAPGNRGGLGLWGPVVDGKILPAAPFDPGAPEMSAHVPMLIGTCVSEFVNGTDNPERDTLTENDLSMRTAERFKNNAGAIIAGYRKQYPDASPFDLWAAMSAAGPRQSAITQAERKAAQGVAPVYMYLYAWRTPMLGGKIGTFHSSEIAFVFDNARLCPKYSGGTSDALALSFNMGKAWANFARTGKPGHSGLPAWPAYDPKVRATMMFDSPCRVQNDPEGAGLRLIPPAPLA
ncbi:MAG TPA: carboxylesterase family protein [Bryobacteraceae bacterium]|nr:carboxylesterase family protein [Bryobacteraceae bacterium]